jgi:hypothetical protein
LEWDRLIIAAFKVFAVFLTSLDKYDGIGYHLPGILNIQIGLSMDAEVAAFMLQKRQLGKKKTTGQKQFICESLIS